MTKIRQEEDDIICFYCGSSRNPRYRTCGTKTLSDRRIIRLMICNVCIRKERKVRKEEGNQFFAEVDT